MAAVMNATIAARPMKVRVHIELAKHGANSTTATISRLDQVVDGVPQNTVSKSPGGEQDRPLLRSRPKTAMLKFITLFKVSMNEIWPSHHENNKVHSIFGYHKTTKLHRGSRTDYHPNQVTKMP